MADPEARMIDAFISYDRRSSAALVARIVDGLRERGFTTWIDVESLTAGEAWPDAIQRALEESRFIIAVVSQGTERSEWIRREWNAGLQSESGSPRLLPLWIGDVEPPPELQQVPGLRIRPNEAESVEAAIESLARRMREPGVRRPRKSEEDVAVVRARSFSLPALDERGYLPEGVYSAPADEILQRFGQFSESRKALSGQLVALLKRAERMGARSLVLGGSFISDTPNPRDLDVVFVLPMAGPVERIEKEASAILSYVASGKSTFVATEGESLDTWINFLSSRFLGPPRGVVQIPLQEGDA